MPNGKLIILLKKAVVEVVDSLCFFLLTLIADKLSVNLEKPENRELLGCKRRFLETNPTNGPKIAV